MMWHDTYIWPVIHFSWSVVTWFYIYIWPIIYVKWHDMTLCRVTRCDQTHRMRRADVTWCHNLSSYLLVTTCHVDIWPVPDAKWPKVCGVKGHDGMWRLHLATYPCDVNSVTWCDLTWLHMAGRDVTWQSLLWCYVLWRDARRSLFGHLFMWHDVMWRNVAWRHVLWHDIIWYDHVYSWPVMYKNKKPNN